ncbi:HAD domain-containing protein [Catellatospora sichuanensis]|uniref:HAD domain-containing protein n=1 Tax=Catellatospora sichuanensis TaxID=1969805 RepID=UPI00118212CD|nr:HAD domain-containing protein [Catellatospora sichuanensis]
MTPPLLFLDVDGPLNPYAAKPERRPEGYLTYRMALASEWGSDVYGRRKPLRVWLRPEHGSELLALPYTLVWATTWTAEANEWIAPVLGLPELPVVEWPQPREAGRGGVHWKTRRLVEWADGRDFAWVDDEVSDADVAWIGEHHPGRALVHRVDARHGLRDGDFAALTAWAQRAPAAVE